MKKGTIIFISIAIALILFVVGFNNRMVGISENVDKSWAEIDNQLKRRADLIPNLVNTVKGYASHEEEVINSITKARAGVVDAKTPEETMKASNELSQALNNFNFVMENYPDLKANENFKDLQIQLEGTENRLTYARTVYNDEVLKYNKQIKRFPNSLIANLLKFDKNKPYFEIEEADRENIKVEF